MIERFEHAGVEALRVGRFSSQINTSCIVYRLGETVIDVGPRNQWRRVRRFLAEREVREALITHHHEDHSGNLEEVRRRTGARVLAPEGALEPLAEGFPLLPYQHLIWGRPARVRPEPLPERVEAGGGLTLLPVAAPGHSADMTCFLEPDRGWLFSGDLYIAARARYLRRDEDVGAYIGTLKRILGLDFDTLFCSHRGVIADGKAALGRKLDFLTGLRDRVRDLGAQGRSAGEITRLLLGREDLMSFLTGFHFSKMNLIDSCLRADGEG